MKLLNTLIFLSLTLMGALPAAVQMGAPAPAFAVLDSTGVERTLFDFKGQYVVLEWTRHDCPFVVKFYQNGDMQALQRQLTAAGAVWLQVASSAPGKVGYLNAEAIEAQRRSTDTRATATLMDTDGKMGRAYDARTTPQMFLINPAGMVIYQGAIDSIASTRSGDIAKATNYLKAAFDSALAGEPIEHPTTTPYGCGVKY
jgi:peroxiredoxin